jgi:hypothetical protein
MTFRRTVMDPEYFISIPYPAFLRTPPPDPTKAKDIKLLIKDVCNKTIKLF